MQSATRRFSPPERVVTSVSPGGSRSASMAISSLRSRSQALEASMRFWSFACSSMRAFISSSSVTSANFMFTALNRSRRSRVSFTASSTFPFTSSDPSSSGSWGR